MAPLSDGSGIGEVKDRDLEAWAKAVCDDVKTLEPGVPRARECLALPAQRK
ncbi:MAG: hypothetical protein M3Z50_14535 [Actinomycetota bacterium]|nr:hypothetical protein [Actinomycetota bacterium]